VGGQVWDPEGSTATWDMKLGRSIDAQEEDISTKNGIDWRASDEPPSQPKLGIGVCDFSLGRHLS